MELLGGGSSNSGQAGSWSPDVLGLNKRQLLQNEVLKRFSDKHQAVRRLKAEISDIMPSMQ